MIIKLVSYLVALMYGIEYSEETTYVWAFFSTLEMVLFGIFLLLYLAERHHII